MKKWEMLAIAIVMTVAMLFMLKIGFEMGRSTGQRDRGEWVKVVDTTFHWEFKKE